MPSIKRVSHRGSLLKGVAVYRVLYQSILNAKLTGRKNLGRKRGTSNRETASLRIQSSKADSNTWESFTRSGLKLESVHQESPRSDVFRKRATKPLWTRDNVRSILPGLWRKRIGLLLSGPKSSFQMKVNFAFHLEIKVPESGGREERHRIHVAWSPVWSLTSFMEMLISFSNRTWHLPTLPKVPKTGSMTMVLLCLIGQQTRLTWTP